MAVSLGPVTFGIPLGLWALLGLIPLIILYLIRPKPKQIMIPSLMFFFHSTGKSRLTSFLKQITKDWLFLIQLLTLLLLAVSFAEPFATFSHDITAENTVIVMDVSASSQTVEGRFTRLERGIDSAKKLVGKQNTIILAKDVPLILVQDVTIDEARKELNRLKPRETGSRLGDAIILAGEVLGGKEGRVIVVSDFINTGGQDHEIAKSVLESRGLVVDFVNTASDDFRRNLGIVRLDIKPDSVSAFVRNYDREERTTTIRAGQLTTEMTIPADGTETFSFETPEGVVEVSLSTKDDFPVDDKVFVSGPTGGKIQAVLLTSNESVFMKNALRASPNVELSVAQLPIVPRGEFDVYVLDQVQQKQILPGTLEDILNDVRDGAVAFINAQDNMQNFDYKGLLNVNVAGQGKTAPVSIAQPARYTGGIEFGNVDEYFKVTPKDDNALVVLTAFEHPLLVISPLGKGKLVYYGIREEASDFKFSPGYPIFWNELLKAVTEQPDVKTLNYKTKDTLLLNRVQTIALPTGDDLKQASLILEYQGTYRLEDRAVASNLLDEVESDVNAKEFLGTSSQEYELRPVKEKQDFPIAVPLLAIAAILLFLEILYVKVRGDI